MREDKSVSGLSDLQNRKPDDPISKDRDHILEQSKVIPGYFHLKTPKGCPEGNSESE